MTIVWLALALPLRRALTPRQRWLHPMRLAQVLPPCGSALCYIIDAFLIVVIVIARNHCRANLRSQRMRVGSVRELHCGSPTLLLGVK
jgi:hypothetical protein